jgi:hypothetical protein
VIRDLVLATTVALPGSGTGFDYPPPMGAVVSSGPKGSDQVDPRVADRSARKNGGDVPEDGPRGAAISVDETAAIARAEAACLLALAMERRRLAELDFPGPTLVLDFSRSR